MFDADYAAIVWVAWWNDFTVEMKWLVRDPCSTTVQLLHSRDTPSQHYHDAV
jgi:hypothetical protein